jgi:hypothetical protein
MSVTGGIERPFGGVGELARAPVGVTAQTISLFDVGTTPLTTVTTTIYMASILLPENLPVNQIGTLVTVAGTETGFWVALCDAGRVVRAVSANTAAATTGFFNQSVLPVSGVPFVTPFAGLYYVALGTVSTVAPQVGAMAALPTVAAASGLPFYCGTSATAATITPPPVGTTLGVITGVAAAQFYAQTL